MNTKNYNAPAAAIEREAIDCLQCLREDSRANMRRHEDFAGGWASAEFHHRHAIRNRDALLAALENLMSYVDRDEAIMPGLLTLDAARAAIAAAKGEA